MQPVVPAPSSPPRRRQAIWLGAAAALVLCALPSIYKVDEDRRNVIAEENARLSRIAERIDMIIRQENAATTKDASAAFNRLVDIAMPYVPGVSISLTSADGTVLARRPDPQAHVGKNVSHSQVFRTHRAAEAAQSAHLAVSALDDAPKVIVARTLSLSDGAPPLYVFATREMSQTMTAWRKRALLEAGQFGCVVFAVLFFAGMATRREGRLQQSLADHTQREALYHSLFQGNKAVKLLIDPTTGAIVDANAAACAYYGYDHKTLTDMRISHINTLSKAEIAAEMAAAESERRSHFFFRHRLASGEIRDVEVHSGPVQYGGRELLYSIIHDITERRCLERERARLFTAIEQSPASIVITDEKGAIRYVNPAFTRISGYNPEEVMGETPRILKSGHTSDEEYTQMWRTISAGKSYSAVFYNKKKDGEFYWEHAQISPVFNKDGEIINYVGVKENITELKKAEENLLDANNMLELQAEKLKSANAELEQFAYVASHDLRQPLRTISSYLQLINKRLSDADIEVREYIDFAVSGAKRMDQLIVALLEYSRIGRMSRPGVPVNLAELLETSRQTYAFALEEAGATLNIAGGLPTVIGDMVELQRLFDNLIGNAVKYRSPDRPLVIRVDGDVSEGAAVITVADNGLGMADVDHDRAFAMFQRLVPREYAEGAGIGLAVCKKIVERHQGKIRINSALGEGCRFIIELPAAPTGEGVS
jgi:PAS domain S-box-containing protein